MTCYKRMVIEMGEARRRGSFEKRKRESIAKQEALNKKRKEMQAEQDKERGLLLIENGKQPRRSSLVMLAAAMAVATGGDWRP